VDDPSSTPTGRLSICDAVRRNDQECYAPSQLTTKGGKLSILLETVAEHGLQYRSGMLRSCNKFCLVSGYIEVSTTLPGPNAETKGVALGFV
jgi:beta-glucan synthesis-associated protein KRE6